MSEYKRLTARTENGKAIYSGNVIEKSLNYEQTILECLAELEDKIESGKWVELPCKVGDTVWVINAWMEYGDIAKGEPHYVTRYELVEGKATGVEIYGNDYRILQDAPQYGVQPYVFTSKAQAEARLKELKGESV